MHISSGIAVIGVSLAFAWEALASPSTHLYDSLSRLRAVRYSDGSVIAYSYDAAGNRLDEIVDTAVPSVLIELPTATAVYSTNSATLDLSGEASDDVAVAEITWTNGLGDSGAATGTTNWRIDDVPLAVGLNVLTVTATDSVGKTAVATLTVTVAAPTSTPSPSRTPTVTAIWTLTYTATCTPTYTATPIPTPPLGPDDCCQCDLPACGAAIAGVCGFCDVVHDAACSAAGVCLTHTPTRTPTSTPTPSRTPTGIGIAGSIRYYATGDPLGGVTVALNGPQSLSTTTTVGGEYRFDGIPAGRWEIAASYSAPPEAGISAYDAAFALQAAAQTRSLSSVQTLACDVDGDGTLTPEDASHLLRYRVGIAESLPIGEQCAATMLFWPVPAAHANQEVVAPQVDALMCAPGHIVLDGLEAWAVGQDFEAVLLGDCTGNWKQP